MPGSAGAGDAADEERVGKVHTGVFSRDLPWLMYGFGDADKPLKVGWIAVAVQCWHSC